MCMIYDDNGNVVVEEKKKSDYYGFIFPGGHIELHESIVDSMIREVYEETGLTISNLELCGTKDWISDDGSRYLVFLYKTTCFSGELVSSAEGHVCWIPISQLKSMPLLWNLEEMLEIFLEHGFTELFYNKTNRSTQPVLK